MFITFEGGEAAGKTTQLHRLAASLRAVGARVIATREPGGSPGAEALRGLLLEGGHAWAPLAETLLHFAARADHVAHTIRPALAAGAIVLCDRFTDSTRAYQGAQGADPVAIEALARLIGLTPDITFVLDAGEATAAARARGRARDPDRYDRLGPGFHARVAAAFRAIAAAEPARCVLIDANGSEAETAARIAAALRARAGGLGLPMADA